MEVEPTKESNKRCSNEGLENPKNKKNKKNKKNNTTSISPLLKDMNLSLFSNLEAFQVFPELPERLPWEILAEEEMIFLGNNWSKLQIR